jgi:hypothetical protein
VLGEVLPGEVAPVTIGVLKGGRVFYGEAQEGEFFLTLSEHIGWDTLVNVDAIGGSLGTGFEDLLEEGVLFVVGGLFGDPVVEVSDLFEIERREGCVG